MGPPSGVWSDGRAEPDQAAPRLEPQLQLREAIENEARAQHIAYTTADLAEGLRAFVERREPEFTGE